MITNEEVLRRNGIERQLINMLRNKKSWIGTVLREDALLKDIMEEK